MKGITPVISIIILLLIAIALSGAAYTYLSGYWGGLTSKSLEITSIVCNNGVMSVYVKNMGNDVITIADDVEVTRSVVSGVDPDYDLAADWDGDTEIAPGGGASFTEIDNEGGGCSDCSSPCGSRTTCRYDFVVAGRHYATQMGCM